MILAIVVSRAGRTGFIGRMETAFDWGEIAECRAGLMPLSKHNVCGSSPAVRILRAKGFHPVEVPVSSPASSQIHNVPACHPKTRQVSRTTRYRSHTKAASFGQATSRRTEYGGIHIPCPACFGSFPAPACALRHRAALARGLQHPGDTQGAQHRGHGRLWRNLNME